MANYLLIESRDPFEWSDVPRTFGLASGLAKEGNKVTLFLVQNGVFPARRSAKSAALTGLTREGVTVLADDFSLRERGIESKKLADGVKSAPLDVVVDQIADGTKTLFF